MDRAEIDEKGRGILFFGKAEVKAVEKIKGQPNVFSLLTECSLERKTQVSPKPGQFYLLRSAKSSVQLDRPISVYRCVENKSEGEGRLLTLEFLILEKGAGTHELCSMLPGEEVELIGPLGNTFSVPDGKKNICIAGGGIGVAPVACFAESLPQESYDFYASFKSGSYGLTHVKARNLFVTTDDGSEGIHGMLSAALTAESIRERGYDCIFACGPTPMLAYIQTIAKEAGVSCYLSMENRMACGVGACLGCTIDTTEGNKRVCKDGPVFAGEILKFEKGNPRRKALSQGQEPDLGVDIAGVHFKNPVIAASGTFGFGQNYRGLFDVSLLGGISGKGSTLEPRRGNPGVRIVEVPSGDINSIGLENPGIPHFIEHELPEMMKLGPVAIANLAGHDLESYVEGARLLDKTNVPMIELNISCPNVKAGGMAFGMDCASASKVVSAVREATSKPLMVKLSPNAPDLRGVAMACVKAGAEALSLVNTIQATAIDIESGKPVFQNIRAGLCGPAIKPIALRMVYDVCEEMNRLPENERIPVVGIGGISSWKDAVEFIMAGASAIQVGTATFTNPLCMVEIIDGLKNFMKSHGYSSIEEMRGIAQVS